MNEQPDIDQLITQAIELKQMAAAGGSIVAEAQLGQEIHRLNEIMDINDLMPGEETLLGMAASERDGSKFSELFLSHIRQKLCSEDGEFYKLIRDGLSASVGAILTALIAALPIPAVALSILVPLSVVICHSGLDAYCGLG